MASTVAPGDADPNDPEPASAEPTHADAEETTEETQAEASSSRPSPSDDDDELSSSSATSVKRLWNFDSSELSSSSATCTNDVVAAAAAASLFCRFKTPTACVSFVIASRKALSLSHVHLDLFLPRLLQFPQLTTPYFRSAPANCSRSAAVAPGSSAAP